MLETSEVSFSFLTAGPQFRLLVPLEFSSVPELSSPLYIDVGNRSFDWIPAVRDSGLTEDVRFVESLTVKDDSQLQIYERIDPEGPRLWWLRWQLENGAVYSHLRDEDGLAQAEAIGNCLTIVEDGGTGTPFLLPEPPLRPAVAAWPGYQEWAVFQSGLREEWAISLRRPTFLKPGEIVQAPASVVGEAAYLRAGAAYGIEIGVSSGTNV